MFSVKSVRYLFYERNIDKVKNSIRVPLGDLKLPYWETDILIHEKAIISFFPIDGDTYHTPWKQVSLTAMLSDENSLKKLILSYGS